MERNGAYETSWADQWDYSNPDPITTSNTNKYDKNNGGGAAKYKQKVGEGLVKTKAVASNGVKKLKEGTSTSINWIKTKYHKTTQKN
ncbi:putative CDP-diacylglycerol--glycerol-3-phosphate 3-phosphatidyltransferase [Quillaja saponaria]|uniref:CDP-diacylglycerol--glycerol-3-phosphate 3-phosphatidyltransferase n=1 Tax=Quillaja saponaria TaxID=32244 RepID=A0AAD7LDT0_QUISA|nr:putative CDP-diacylglycerol--glycerol-3-phosphate 3-phosphatidyltransferase [Quillaja saponaria]